MPLNPNGKIDKPALPFPDTAEVAAVESRRHPSFSSEKMTPMERAVQRIWSTILTNAPTPIALSESFFDLGGHSILATRLIFELRKSFVVSAPLSLVFDYPTIREQAQQLDALRNSDLGLLGDSGESTGRTAHLAVPGSTSEQKSATATPEYAKDYDALLSQLRPSYDALPSDFGTKPLTVFLTGATGFLGAFILRDLLSRRPRVAKVLCHVRASDREKGLQRLREGCADRGVWDEDWINEKRVEVVVGDLAKERIGIDASSWEYVATEADVLLHNGALVCCTTTETVGSRLQFGRCIGFTLTTNCAPQTCWRR